MATEAMEKNEQGEKEKAAELLEAELEFLRPLIHSLVADTSCAGLVGALARLSPALLKWRDATGRQPYEAGVHAHRTHVNMK